MGRARLLGFLLLLVSGVFAGTLLSAGGASAEAPCKMPPPGFAAEAKCQWWSNHEPAVVSNSTCCLPLLQKAQAVQDKALVHNAKARDPKVPEDVRKRELDLANKLFEKRSELLRKFTDCVNAVIHAMNLPRSKSKLGGAIGAACGCKAEDIANLGYRCCADLSSSPYQVDLNIRTDNASTDHNFDFNCHYYTKMYLHTVSPGSPYPERTPTSDNLCLKKETWVSAGFSRVPGRVYVGDIVATQEPDPEAHVCKWAHSGIVTAVNPDGTPKTIRQKDGPNTCVVDLSYEDFRKAWVDAAGTSAKFFTNPEARGEIP